jgi:hypothetical protein
MRLTSTLLVAMIFAANSTFAKPDVNRCPDYSCTCSEDPFDNHIYCCANGKWTNIFVCEKGCVGGGFTYDAKCRS